VFYFTNTAGNIAAPEAGDAAFFADDVYMDQDGINLTDPTGAGGGGSGGVGSGLVNISTRGEVLSGDKIMITGFVISGAAPQKVLIRAAGPGLQRFGVAGTLSTPVLKLISRTGETLATNTGWETAPDPAEITAAANQVGAFAFAAGSADSAIITTLSPGVYTAQVTGSGTATGVALVEVYSVGE
jgi:hypothetical protein